nr:MAG TPA: hypothetical protein [Caudoviricetes sp.]
MLDNLNRGYFFCLEVIKNFWVENIPTGYPYSDRYPPPFFLTVSPSTVIFIPLQPIVTPTIM